MTHSNTRGICAVCQRIYDSLLGEDKNVPPNKTTYMREAEIACIAAGIEPLRKTIDRQYGHRRAWHATRELAKLNGESSKVWGHKS
jgi:hypothetical protein